MEQRENLGSRLGFIMLSAGCAIGIGNVWRFPYMVGKYILPLIIGFLVTYGLVTYFLCKKAHKAHPCLHALEQGPVRLRKSRRLVRGHAGRPAGLLYYPGIHF